MSRRALLLFLALLCGVAYEPTAGWSQVPAAIPNHAPLGASPRNIEKQDWHIFGRVISFRGEPVGEASVRQTVSAQAELEGPKDQTIGIKFVRKGKRFRTGEFFLDISSP